jgi:hypothetical protein
MNCFNHRTSSAIGVCRGCNKSVCDECLFWHEQPIGIVCSEDCKTKIDKLIATMAVNEKLREQAERDKSVVYEQMRDTQKMKAKNRELQLNLAKGNKNTFYLCTVGTLGLYGYSFAYAKFFDWYFSFSLGTIMLIIAFASYHRAIALNKFASDD